MKILNHGLLTLLIVLGLAISACASPAPQAPAPSPQAPAAPAVPLTREQKLVEGAKKEGEVSLWVVTIAEREKLIAAFQQKHPFLKLKIWDSSEAEMLAKLTEEAKIGRHSVDVLIGNLTADVYNMGLLTEYEFPNTVGWTDQPKHKYYQTFYASPRITVYNTDLVSPAEAPRSWDDIKSTKWAGKTILSISGWGYPLFWAYLWRENDKLNWDKSLAFWGDVVRNTKPKTAIGYTGPLGRVVAGEVPVFIGVSTPATLRLLARGAPIGIAPMGNAPGDAAGIALMKDMPHPNAARLLIDFLTSPDGLLAYSEPTMAYVVAPKLQGRARANLSLGSLGIRSELTPQELLTAENLKKSTEFWEKALGVRG